LESISLPLPFGSIDGKAVTAMAKVIAEITEPFILEALGFEDKKWRIH
jgi:hypothetical protein